DLAALEQLLVRVSHLVVEQPWIKEIDLNPLHASPEALVALDARVILHAPDTPVADLPRPAIRPYPVEYVGTWQAKDGELFTIRPIRPDDEPLMVVFHGTLSEQSVYFRYLSPMTLSQRVSHDRLSNICFVDYDHDMVLVAERVTPAREIVAPVELAQAQRGGVRAAHQRCAAAPRAGNRAPPPAHRHRRAREAAPDRGLHLQRERRHA